VFLSSRSLSDILAGAGSGSFLINSSGQVLAGPAGDEYRVMIGGASPFMRGIFRSDDRRRQSLYTGAYGKQYFGAYQKLENLSVAVMTIIPYDTVFAGVSAAAWRNIFISAVALLLSIMLIFIYSRSLSRPLKALIRSSRQIENGDYELNLKPGGRDEIGVLTRSFIRMGHGLVNFEMFTNKAVVALARKGLLTRTGEGKSVTVCFAIIRDFSETFGHFDAQETVGFVNSFLAAMVPRITKTGGTVDKFLTQGGVVIMALWGAAESAGSVKADAFACIKSALMMRNALRKLNQAKAAPFIKIGCGINSGEVVAGQIGSDKRMEYTVIGDAVNLAARIEGPNDLFDTDILITENTYSLIGKNIIAEEMPSLEVKGKEKPLRVFAVVNLRDPEKRGNPVKGPRTMEEVRESWR
jgi:adenylate cyclase